MANIVLQQSFLYTYEIWQNKQALLQSDKTFYRSLKKDYRVDIISRFEYPHIVLPNP